MADEKPPSNMPDFKEITEMAGKLYRDVKQSICSIIDDYKAKRPEVPKPKEEEKNKEEKKE